MEKPENRVRHTLRILRPLIWWLILVLVLYGIRMHQRLMENTRISFNVTLQGRPVDASVMVDGIPAFSGQNISLGNHTFTVAYSKAESFSTNLFIWYGGHNFGNINLKRASGVLTVSVDPPARLLTIQGPEWSVTLTNSSGLSETVPTDDYTVTAQYRYFKRSQMVRVFAKVANPLKLAPRVGSLDLSCNQSNATFQLLDSNNQFVETGNFPMSIAPLPTGTYQLLAWHDNHRRIDSIEITAGATTNVAVEFQYGAALLETKPPGAEVTAADGQKWGTTPVLITELQPGRWDFSLRLNDYEPATASLDITDNETNTFDTNLVNISYATAMRSAREYMDAGEYDKAGDALTTALQYQSDDHAAIALQKQAIGLGNIARAEALAKKGDYTAGIKELGLALAVLPDNAQARQMLADFKRREPEQLERLRKERMALPKKVFDSTVGHVFGAGTFQNHELTTGKSAADVMSAIVAQLKMTQPPFHVTRSDLAGNSQMFRIEATQEFSGGSRHCVVAGGQSKDNETQIFFTVLESKKISILDQPITSLVGATPLEYTLINPSDPNLSEKLKNQIADGVQIVTGCIQKAIGNPSTGSSQ